MASKEQYDLVVIGSGPAGLSAAITAESEWLDTLVLESCDQLGGQAGTSSNIENYPGFPGGVTGHNLMSNMVDQARGFGAEFLAPVRVTEVAPAESGVLVRTCEGMEYLAAAALLGTGVENRRLSVRNLAAYLGRGATYGSPAHSETYTDRKLVVVGGANSAGQAAVHLSEFKGSEVSLLIRGESIEEGMSGYLIDKIRKRGNISVHTETELVGVDGNGRLDSVSLKNNGEVRQAAADNVFVLIGSVPKTTWLPPEVARDKHGYVVPGSNLSAEQRAAFAEQTNGRAPYLHETSMPGLFVAGDVKSGSHKRVASAAGDGVGVVPEIHKLRETRS